MSADKRLKVMALGDALTIRRLNACMGNNAVDLVGLSKMPDVIDYLHQERFDVILIDSLFEEAGNACRCIYKMACAPVALLVGEKEANWHNLCSWEVDGFVPEESGQVELVARIRAISRRSQKIPKTPD